MVPRNNNIWSFQPWSPVVTLLRLLRRGGEGGEGIKIEEKVAIFVTANGHCSAGGDVGLVQIDVRVLAMQKSLPTARHGTARTQG